MRSIVLTLALMSATTSALAQRAPLITDLWLTDQNDHRYYSLACNSGGKITAMWTDVRKVVVRTIDTQRIYYFEKGLSAEPVTYTPAANESCETFRK